MNFLKRGFKAAKSALFGDCSDSDGDDSSGRGGFSHKKQVVVERTKVPVVQYCVSMYGGEPMGGIQGLWWYAKSLVYDADGDVANQFLVEPGPGPGRGCAMDGREADDGDGEGRGGDGKARYGQALVEVKGVCKGEVLLQPCSLD